MASICISPSLGFPIEIAIPSYFYPGAQWEVMTAASDTVRISVINPNSGPGTALDPAYAVQVRKAHTADLRVLGYVSTRFGERPITEVKSEIDLYYLWYGVSGIFLDEAATDCKSEEYYSALNRHIKRKSRGALTVLNPGTSTRECYINAADIIVNFEGTYKTYLKWAPTWERKYDARRFWNLIYAAPSIRECDNAFHLANSRNAGWVYVTHLDLPNPWAALPNYWEAQVAGVQRIAKRRKSPVFQ